jgi:hypothetical protein
MNSFLKNSQNKVLAILGVLILVFNLWLLPLGTEGKIPLDLKFGYDKEEVLRVLEEIGEDTLPKYRFGLLVTDMIYPFVYGGFLSLLLLRVWGKRWILMLPVFVMLLDIDENLSILTLVDTFPQLSDSDVERASLLTSAKWVMVVITFTMLIVGFLKEKFRK